MSFETAQKARLLRTNGALLRMTEGTVRPEEARFLRRLEGHLEEHLRKQRIVGIVPTDLELMKIPIPHQTNTSFRFLSYRVPMYSIV